MNIWIVQNGSHWKPYPLATIPKPVIFPRFALYPNELPTARTQRWKQTFKELSNQQHDFMISVAAWALKLANSPQRLEAELRDWGDSFAANKDLELFVYRVVDQPMELTVSYRLTGSSQTHQLTFSLLSPSMQEQQCIASKN